MDDDPGDPDQGKLYLHDRAVWIANPPKVQDGTSSSSSEFFIVQSELPPPGDPAQDLLSRA